MAAIGRKLVGAAVTMLALAGPIFADRAADVRSQMAHIATALTDGNPSDAMAPFDKSFSNYEQLRNYFGGLTSSYQLLNEVDVTDEQDTDDETKLTVNWTLTMTDVATSFAARRSAEINVRLVQEGGKWKIVDFSPIEVFNPQQKTK